MKIKKDIPIYEKCSTKNTEEPHTCPYKEDINNDSESLCYCSEEQQYQCRQDI